jgi:predicted DNA binding CopG/RHH family protein
MIMKRLNVEIPEELLKAVKIRAIQRNITLRIWVLRAIKQALSNEEQYD